ncbi:MAG TPA: CPBP family intramembrane glutamic endopeptidase [Microvirga sp.]|nr:CPBP family intramembrane glutamic endopeptidase [Microvirga sp.]
MIRFLRPFLILGTLGLAGVAALAPTLDPLVARIRSLPDAPPLPEPLLVLVLLAQPALLALAGVALGIACAERAGFTSVLLRRSRGEPAAVDARRIPATILLAMAVAAGVAAADWLLRTRHPSSYGALPRLDEVSGAGRVAALLYGGITEELVMRFGLMSALTALGIRVLGRRPPALIAAAILVSALVFGAAHLPAVLTAAPADGVILARTIGLNAGLGSLYGWLYATRNLEHAMLAHAATHGVFWTATPLLAALLG